MHARGMAHELHPGTPVLIPDGDGGMLPGVYLSHDPERGLAVRDTTHKRVDFWHPSQVRVAA